MHHQPKQVQEAPFARAHGFTGDARERATGGTSKVDVSQAANAITAIVESLDLVDLTLVFHDLGGPAVLQAAADWPERVSQPAAVNTFGWRPSGAAFRTMLALMGSPTMRELDAWTGWLPRLTSTRMGVGRNLVV